MKHILISIALLFAVGCQETAPTQDTGMKASPGKDSNVRSSSDEKALVSESSEGVVGPDEAFFAAFYLNELFELSQSSKSMTGLLGSGIKLQDAKVESAFDFDANFQPKRLDLMCKALMKMGDSNSDEAISADEWNELQYKPASLGMPGEAVSHQFQKEMFDVLAGNDDSLSMDECKSLLVRTGPLVEQMLGDQADMRREILSAWDKVLTTYDSDKDGKLSLPEQKELRKDRAQIVSQLGL